ncbi:hypothetical protein SAY87_024202 [Trapa incisa]|uniref:mannose-6-phosphate isomerase n=1 Tax=Trapa incisa TaxID=236973 RepID=A0AAN7L7S0_9MYRT|nr:hypothetical protein SAY87_024202 [Trapa incisa]
MESSEPVRLSCSVKNYDWGCQGGGSQVAKLASLNSGAGIDPQVPYAEFWMGTHDSGPSFLQQANGQNGAPEDLQGVTLKSWISKNPSVLGEEVLQKWGYDLPFLFKVLSIAKALSIQAHPDKELARKLHATHPNLYKDDNHKPEMALAITKFEALCGFVSAEELKEVLHHVPEIVELVGTADAEKYLSLNEEDETGKTKSILQSIFTQLMSAKKDQVFEVVSKLKNRLELQSQARELSDKEQLVLRLEKQYPADVGVISAFFLNYVKLNPGEALYLGANEPHAYLSGECIECMATSDNVVRAGLTPKHRDVQTLCSMLTYNQGSPEILRGFPLNPYIKRFVPPFDEFEIDSCFLPKELSTIFPAVPGPSIFVVTEGSGNVSFRSNLKGDPLNEGDVLFVPANTEISLMSGTGTDLRLYRAGVNSRLFKAQ